MRFPDLPIRDRRFEVTLTRPDGSTSRWTLGAYHNARERALRKVQVNGPGSVSQVVEIVTATGERIPRATYRNDNGVVTGGEDDATPYPHPGGCAACYEERRCNACGSSTRGDFGRCTNGRCSQCHRTVCTDGGATAPGHGYGDPQRAAEG